MPASNCNSLYMYTEDYSVLRSDAKLRGAVYAQGQFSCDMRLAQKNKTAISDLGYPGRWLPFYLL